MSYTKFQAICADPAAAVSSLNARLTDGHEKLLSLKLSMLHMASGNADDTALRVLFEAGLVSSPGELCFVRWGVGETHDFARDRAINGLFDELMDQRKCYSRDGFVFLDLAWGLGHMYGGCTLLDGIGETTMNFALSPEPTPMDDLLFYHWVIVSAICPESKIHRLGQ